ncbi:MAG: isopentenyl phosphate kinase family protein [Methanotrichaceae archaeon]|nr:isopentenyl phosphate kinase family protein [Methanotrichaceae archaeon]
MTSVLKIGGSILTDKTRPQCARMDEIERLAREIAAAASDLVLVHGAGSFGHAPAKKYGLPDRFSPEGLRVTHQSVVKLNRLVVEALVEAGLYAVPVHPFSGVLLREGRIEQMPVSPIEEMVKDGLLPVLHGDVAMDKTRQAGIVSGDQLVPYLARALRAEVIAVGTNVDGVLFQGEVLPVISREDLPRIDAHLGKGSGIDVTGGMRGKLLELLELAESGTSSVIFNAGIAGNITRALSGEELGTRVVRSR